MLAKWLRERVRVRVRAGVRKYLTKQPNASMWKGSFFVFVQTMLNNDIPQTVHVVTVVLARN